MVVAALLASFGVAGSRADATGPQLAAPAAEPVSALVTFSGPITLESIATLIGRAEAFPVQRLLIDSPGGDVGAGLTLGRWIADHGIDVEVVGLCASSCANYVFAAARRKIIDDGGLVVWHGSVLQKDLRDRAAACPWRLAALRDGEHDLIEYDTGALAVEEGFCTSWSSLAGRQAAFYDAIGIDETVTRLGQEPRDFHAPWTVPVDVMARFGLRAVEAPRGYASVDYMRRFNPPDDPAPILSLGFDANGTVVELAR